MEQLLNEAFAIMIVTIAWKLFMGGRSILKFKK